MTLFLEKHVIHDATYYLIGDPFGVSFISSPDPSPEEISRFFRDADFVESTDRFHEASEFLHTYLGGRKPTGTPPISFHTGTALQQKVWETISTIEYGKTLSYLELAKKSGYPHAVRAVASAVASNPVLFLIPCHRVVRHDGSVGQFRAGKHIKKRLLELEKAVQDALV